MPTRDTHAGFVLVGGASTRMGQDKASLPFHGRTLVEHVADAVAEAAGSVTLVGAPERYESLRLPRIPDTRPGCGPLAGIHAALTASQSDWNLIVACDMPGISGAFLQTLLCAAESSAEDCLIPVGPSGRLEPLCAAYHLRCLPAIGAALDRGVRKVTEGLTGVRIRKWPTAESSWFSNVNTPAEWMRHTHG
jgi:molybdopterin-guanine dinucleotide biosynthesis protein A